MKEKVKTEYYRRERKMLKTKLNGGNIIKGINTRTNLSRLDRGRIRGNDNDKASDIES